MGGGGGRSVVDVFFIELLCSEWVEGVVVL